MFGVKVLGGFALDKNGLRLDLQDSVHGQQVSLTEVLERGDERAIGAAALIPPAVLCRKGGGDKDLVDRRIIAHPGKALGEGAGIGGEQRRPVGILEAADPVRDAKVAEVNDGADIQGPQHRKRLVGKAPVIAVWAGVGRIVGRPIAQVGDAQLFHRKRQVSDRRRASGGGGLRESSGRGG